MIEIELPLPKIKEKSKVRNLSLNVYKVAYYRHLNDAKKNYEHIAYLKLKPYKKIRFKEASITYTLFCKNRHRRDLANFLTVIDKFVSDTLVSIKIIEDDDITHIKSVNYRFGGYGEDKVIVRVEDNKDIG